MLKVVQVQVAQLYHLSLDNKPIVLPVDPGVMAYYDPFKRRRYKREY